MGVAVQPVTPGPGRLQPEDLEFQASLGSTVRSCPQIIKEGKEEGKEKEGRVGGGELSGGPFVQSVWKGGCLHD